MWSAKSWRKSELPLSCWKSREGLMSLLRFSRLSFTFPSVSSESQGKNLNVLSPLARPTRSAAAYQLCWSQSLLPM